jgi:hypothetical protein
MQTRMSEIKKMQKSMPARPSESVGPDESWDSTATSISGRSFEPPIQPFAPQYTSIFSVFVLHLNSRVETDNLQVEGIIVEEVVGPDIHMNDVVPVKRCGTCHVTIEPFSFFYIFICVPQHLYN